MESLRDELLELLGSTGLSRLIDHAGGRRIYVPRSIKSPIHWLPEILGREAAERLAFRYGGCRICVPRNLPPGPRDERIRELRRRGWSVAGIARHADLSERQVYRIIAEA